MIVYNNNIVFEICFLRQCRCNSVSNGLLTIENRDYDRCFNAEIAACKVGLSVFLGVYQPTYGAQMCSGSTLHFYLYLTITGIYVVELLFSASAQVVFFLCVKVFVQVENLTFST